MIRPALALLPALLLAAPAMAQPRPGLNASAAHCGGAVEVQTGWHLRDNAVRYYAVVQARFTGWGARRHVRLAFTPPSPVTGSNQEITLPPSERRDVTLATQPGRAPDVPLAQLDQHLVVTCR